MNVKILISFLILSSCWIEVLLDVELEVAVRNVGDINRYLRNVSVYSYESYLFLFYFNSLTIIDESLDFTYLAQRISLDQVDLRLGQVKGFAVTRRASPFVIIPKAFTDLGKQVIFENSRLDFYDQQGRLLGPSCDEYLMSFHNITRKELEVSDMQTLVKTFVSTFSQSFPLLSFSKTVGITKTLCPLIFKDANIETLLLNIAFEKNFIKTQVFEFSEPPLDLELNIFIQTFASFSLYRITFESFLDVRVFENLKIISFQGTLLAMNDENFFKNFDTLRFLHFSVQNLREFLHSSNNRWMANLNYQIGINSSEWCLVTDYSSDYLESKTFVLNLNDDLKSYTYPEEDFCLFRHFPHNHNAVLTPTQLSDRNCLAAFLFTFSYCYEHFNEQNLPVILESLIKILNE